MVVVENVFPPWSLFHIPLFLRYESESFCRWTPAARATVWNNPSSGSTVVVTTTWLRMVGFFSIIRISLRSSLQALTSHCMSSLPLLQKAGQAHALPHRSVGSWDEALQLCHSEPWDALQLMTKNRQAELVNRLNWDRCQEWNGVCSALRPEISKIVEATVARISAARKVTDHLRGTVSWDVLCILLEREFDDVTPPAFYVPVLLPVYQAGHLPCGWTGSKLDTNWSANSAPLPAGELLIY